jgi:transcription-repair coupling factor (superfamily II helicase)
MVVICSEPTVAQRLSQEIPLFNNTLRVSLLPDWEILPYDQFSPHHDLVSERLKTLHEMMNGLTDIVIVPISSAIIRLAPPEFLVCKYFLF